MWRSAVRGFALVGFVLAALTPTLAGKGAGEDRPARGSVAAGAGLDETTPALLAPSPRRPASRLRSAGPRAAEIEKLMGSYMSQSLFSGAVLAIEGGETVYARGLGYANREWLIPNATSTRFRIASVSKSFTEVLLLQLEEDGLLSRSQTISDHLPEYRGPGANIITIDQLINHRSGIVTESSVEDLERIERDYYTQEEMLELISGYPLLFAPGTAWAYSNFGYYLLGVILERASGQSYGELLAQRICSPAGMTDTFREVTGDIVERRASGHWYIRGSGFILDSPLDMSFVFGYGQLISTVGDLARFATALRDGVLLSPANTHAVVDARERDTPIGNGQCSDLAVELGPGSINGFRASVHTFTRSDRIVVVLENVRGGSALPGVFQVGRNIAAVLYGCPYDPPAPPS